MKRRHAITDSPLGPITIVRAHEGIVRISIHGQQHLPERESFGERDDSSSPEVLEQLGEYFAGERETFTLDLVAEGTPFQLRVWQALSTIPYGQTWTYGDVARALGQPTASRAVGFANGRNPHAIAVPCHRVIGADGSLTGYAGGLDAKRTLLTLERRRLDLMTGASVA